MSDLWHKIFENVVEYIGYWCCANSATYKTMFEIPANTKSFQTLLKYLVASYPYDAEPKIAKILVCDECTFTIRVTTGINNRIYVFISKEFLKEHISKEEFAELIALRMNGENNGEACNNNIR